MRLFLCCKGNPTCSFPRAARRIYELGVSVDFIMYGKNEENSELLSEAMDVLSDMDELQIRQCLAMMKAMKSVSVEK